MRNVFVSHDKMRSNIGAVGATAKHNMVHINMAKRWDVKHTNGFLDDMFEMYQEIGWDNTYMDQELGEYIIQDLKQRGIPVKVITTQKNLKDAKKIERVLVMDRIEMAEYLRSLKLAGKVKFAKNPSPALQQIEVQMPMFAKHTTEAGGVDYYAPGEEPDDLIRSLIGVCFSVRRMIVIGAGGHTVLGGVRYPEGRGQYRDYDAMAAVGRFESFI